MFDKGLLMAGVDFHTTSGISLKHPKLEMVTKLGITNYFNFMSLFMTQPHEIMVELDDKGVDFEKTTSFELFIDMVYPNYEYFCGLFPHFSNIQYVLPGEDKKTIFYMLEGENEALEFTEDIFDEIAMFVKEIHMRTDSKPPKFKNQAVKEIYIEIQREEKELNKSPDFSKLISALVWCEESSYKYSDIWELYMYQFYDGIKTVTDSKDFKGITMGLYSGTIDQKSIGKNRLNWIRS